MCSVDFPAKPVGKVWNPLAHLRKNNPPKLFQLKKENRFYFYLRRYWKKVDCTENCLKITQTSETRRWIARLCPRLPMILMKAIRTHHSVDCASPGYTFYLILNTARPNVLGHVKLLFGGEEKGKFCVTRHPWVCPWTTLVPRPPEGSWWFSLLSFHRCSARLELPGIVLQVPRVLPQPQ